MAGLTEHATRLGLGLRGWRSRHVPTSAGAVHLLEAAGAGVLPTMVFLHGFTSAGCHYGPLLERFRSAAGLVVAPDLPAHGFSDVPPQLDPDALYQGLREALDATVVEPAVFVGNSMGGAVALRYALDRPERVRGLALIAPGGAPMTPAELAGLKRLFEVRSQADALAFVDRVMVRPGAMRQVYAAGIHAGFRRPAMRELLAAITPEHAVTAAELRGLRVPTRVLWGAEERVFPASGRAFFEAHLPPHGRVEVVRGIGHCAHLDDCDRTARVVLRWTEEFARLGRGTALTDVP